MLCRQCGQPRLDSLADNGELFEQALVLEQIQVLTRAACWPEWCRRADERATPGVGPQVAHNFEQTQRLAHGRPADAEEIAQLALGGELLADSQATLVHEGLQ